MRALVTTQAGIVRAIHAATLALLAAGPALERCPNLFRTNLSNGVRLLDHSAKYKELPTMRVAVFRAG
jgi:hypothetical protein